jgi:hypothetical protein
MWINGELTERGPARTCAAAIVAQKQHCAVRRSTRNGSTVGDIQPLVQPTRFFTCSWRPFLVQDGTLSPPSPFPTRRRDDDGKDVFGSTDACCERSHSYCADGHRAAGPSRGSGSSSGNNGKRIGTVGSVPPAASAIRVNRGAPGGGQCLPLSERPVDAHRFFEPNRTLRRHRARHADRGLDRHHG